MTLSLCIYFQENIVMGMLHEQQNCKDQNRFNTLKRKVKELEKEGFSSQQIFDKLRKDIPEIADLVDTQTLNNHSMSTILDVLEMSYTMANAMEYDITKLEDPSVYNFTRQQKTFYNEFYIVMEELGYKQPSLGVITYMLNVLKKEGEKREFLQERENEEREFSQILDLRPHKMAPNDVVAFLTDLKKLRNKGLNLILVIGEALYPEKKGRFKQGGKNIYVFLDPDRRELAQNCFEQGRIGIHATAGDLQFLCEFNDANGLFNVIIDDIGRLSEVVKYSTYIHDTANIETLYKAFVFLTKPGGLIITDPMAYGQMLSQKSLPIKDIKLSNKLEKPGIDTQSFDKVSFSQPLIWEIPAFDNIKEANQKLKSIALSLYNILFEIQFSKFCEFQQVPEDFNITDISSGNASNLSVAVISDKITMYSCLVALGMLNNDDDAIKLLCTPVGCLLQRAAEIVSMPGSYDRQMVFSYLISSVAFLGACDILQKDLAEKLAKKVVSNLSTTPVTEILKFLFGEISLVLRTPTQE
jgi:hypothetical protein